MTSTKPEEHDAGHGTDEAGHKFKSIEPSPVALKLAGEISRLAAKYSRGDGSEDDDSLSPEECLATIAQVLGKLVSSYALANVVAARIKLGQDEFTAAKFSEALKASDHAAIQIVKANVESGRKHGLAGMLGELINRLNAVADDADDGEDDDDDEDDKD